MAAPRGGFDAGGRRLYAFAIMATVDIDEELARAAAARAAREGRTLGQAVEAALRDYLRPSDRAARSVRVELLTKRGKRAPGAAIDDRERLYALMDADDRSRSTPTSSSAHTGKSRRNAAPPALCARRRAAGGAGAG